MAMRAGVPRSKAAHDSGSRNAHAVDERSSRLLPIASGVAAAVGISALGLAVVVSYAGFSDPRPAEVELAAPNNAARATQSVHQINSPADVSMGDRAVHVSVERRAPEPEQLPASPPDHAPAHESAANPGGSAQKPSVKDAASKDTSGGDGAKSKSQQPATPSGRTEESGEKAQKQPPKGSESATPDEVDSGSSRWWDGSEAIWYWGAENDWGSDSRWGEHLLRELTRLIPEQHLDRHSNT